MNKRRNEKALTKTDLPLKLFKRGKVRDVYEFENKLLIIATDRISAFDNVLPTPIPMKGVYLTKLSNFWFRKTKHIIPNHLLEEMPEKLNDLSEYGDVLEGRAVLVEKAEPVQVECVVRGFLAGSMWKDYKEGKANFLPSGLEEGEKLEEPIFTPTTKAQKGHDLPITKKQLANMVGKNLAAFLKETSISMYNYASDYVEKKGMIIADTKFEFGRIDGKILLIDELFTPDSSRYWPREEYSLGKHPYSLDKQYVRDYLEKIGWDKKSSPPELPEDVVEETRRRYKEIYERIVLEE
jgi:phosphoribosylaminoimidazole-succinocarboxamide synthase